MHNFQYARMHKSLHMDALTARTSQLLALCTALAFAFFLVYFLTCTFMWQLRLLTRPASPPHATNWHLL